MAGVTAPTVPRARPRCSVLSETAAEPLAGTAATDTRWLFVEVPGAWGRKAVTGSDLPEAVVAALTAYDGRVQLVRRPGPAAARAGVQVLAADLGDGSGTTAQARVTSARLGRLDDVVDLAPGDLAPHTEPVWLVCTNGRRDLCCAERGRPVASALAALRPEQTWETTHLGGHRYAATALHLPSGLVLGRLEATTVPDVLAEVEAGRVPLALTRGLAGRHPAAQAAELAVRERGGWSGLDEVAAEEPVDGTVVCRTPAGRVRATVERRTGPAGLASCADDHPKPTTEHVVVDVQTLTEHD